MEQMVATPLCLAVRPAAARMLAVRLPLLAVAAAAARVVRSLYILLTADCQDQAVPYLLALVQRVPEAGRHWGQHSAVFHRGAAN